MQIKSIKFSVKFVVSFAVLLILLVSMATYSIQTIKSIAGAAQGLVYRNTQTEHIEKYRNLIVALKLQSLDMIVEIDLEEKLSKKSQAVFSQFYIDIQKESQALASMLDDAQTKEISERLISMFLNYYAGLAKLMGQKIYFQIPSLKPAVPFSKLDKMCLQLVNQLGETIRAKVKLASKRVTVLSGRAQKIWFIIIFAIVVALLIGLFMIFSLRDFRNKITQSLAGVRHGTIEISSQNEQLADRTNRQSDTLNHSAATLEEITTTIKQTSDHVQVGFQLSEATSKISDEGKIGGEQTLQAMKLIIEHSDKIKQIVGLINEIAFQTNILAINAAIEAAKAEDKGKGFAVVAIEVRDLAARSSEAAKEIDDLVKTTLEKLGLGEKLVQRNWQMMQDISDHTRQVNDVMGDITRQTKEHFSAISSFNETIQEFGNDTQQNSALVDSLNQSSKSLDQQCASTVQMVIQSL